MHEYHIGAYGFCYSILNVPYQELTQLSVATKRQCLPSRLPHCGVGDALTCQLSTKKDLRALPGGLFGNYLVIETQSFNYTVASNTYRSVM